MSIHTSTPDEQLRADEDFARQLAEQEELGNIYLDMSSESSYALNVEAIRRRQTSERNEPQPPQMPVRKQGGPTVVIAPKSPLELDEYDYEGNFLKKKKRKRKRIKRLLYNRGQIKCGATC